VLIVNDTASATVVDPGTKKKTLQDEVLPFLYTAAYTVPAKLPAIHVRRAVIDEILGAAARTNLTSLEGRSTGSSSREFRAFGLDGQSGAETGLRHQGEERHWRA
jgi:hypothetical protein